MAIVLDSEKFSALFTSIEKQMLIQSSLLRSMSNLQSQRFAFEKDRARDADRAKARAELEAEKISEAATKKDDDTVGSSTKNADKNGNAFLDALFPGIGTFFGEMLSPRSIPKLLRSGAGFAFKAGVLAMIAPMLGDFVGGFANAALKDIDLNSIGISEEGKANFAQALGTGVHWATLGRILGKRMALITGLAGFTSDLAGSIFNSYDKNKDGVIEAFGAEFTTNDIETLGGVVGAAIGLAAPGLIKAGLGPIFASMLTPGIGLVALTGAALLGGVVLIDKWMDNRRNEVIDKINDNIADGLKEFQEEKNRSKWDKFVTGLFGVDPDKDGMGAQLETLRSDIRSAQIAQYGVQDDFGGEGDTGYYPPLNLNDPKMDQGLSARLLETKPLLEKAINDADLNYFSRDKLELLSEVAGAIGMKKEKSMLDAKISELNELIASADKIDIKDSSVKRLFKDPGSLSVSNIEELATSPTARINRLSITSNLDRIQAEDIAHSMNTFVPGTKPFEPLTETQMYGMSPINYAAAKASKLAIQNENASAASSLVGAASVIATSATESAKVMMETNGIIAKAIGDALRSKSDGGGIILNGGSSNVSSTLGGGHQ